MNGSHEVKQTPTIADSAQQTQGHYAGHQYLQRHDVRLCYGH